MPIRLDGDNATATPGITGGDADTGLVFGTDEVSVVTGGTQHVNVNANGDVDLGGLTVSGSAADDSVNIDSSGRLGIGTTSPQGDLEVSNSSAGATIRLSRPSSADFEFYASSDTFVLTDKRQSSERLRIDNAGKVGIGQTSFSGDGERLGVKGDTNTFSTYCVRFINSDGTVLFRVRNDGRFFTGVDGSSPFNLTTASSANVFVGSDGTLHRGGVSSARFKTDIEDLEDEYANQILNLRPVWYRSTAPGDQLHPDWSYYGFIAEEVAEIDPRFVLWTTHETVVDDDGVETQSELDQPIAESVQYDRFVPHLVNLIKRQQAAIEALEAKVAALEANS